MLFNSKDFLFFFFPIFLLLYFCLSFKYKNQVLIIISSIIFYSYWSFKYALLLFLIISINYYLINNLIKYEEYKKKILFIIIVLNIAILFYFKYFLDIINYFNINSSYNFINNIILPLGISFYIFQIISYALDLSNNKKLKVNFINYFSFIIFFPQLIAGPILRINEFYPYILRNNKINITNFSLGLILFVVGLSKKVLIADNIGTHVDEFYIAVEYNDKINFINSWQNIFLYTFQIYYDFSGYSDMAIGIAKILGFNFPFNFESPLKQTSIINFWQRWNITLTRITQNYIFNYLVLTISRSNFFKKYFDINIIFSSLITFVLIGIWHGSGLNFFLFGLLHAIFYNCNFLFRKIKFNFLKNNSLKYFYWFITFLCISISFIFFRAPNVEVASLIIQNLFNFDNFNLKQLVVDILFNYKSLSILIIILILINILFINSKELVNYLELKYKKKNYLMFFFGLIVSIGFLLCLLELNEIKTFIYYQF